MIYLASPYSHPLREVRKRRFHAIRKYAALCMAKGEVVISPIAYGHQFAEKYGKPGSYDYWQRLSERLILGSDLVRVLKIDGWDKSFGVAEEIKFADDNGIKVTYVEWNYEDL